MVMITEACTLSSRLPKLDEAETTTELQGEIYKPTAKSPADFQHPSIGNGEIQQAESQ